MANISRNHHYLSQCYLRGFLPDGKKPQLTVLNLEQGRDFSTTTRNVAGVRDFNRIDVEDVEPDAIEKGLSGFESELAGGLRKLREQRSLDDEMVYALVMNLMAMVTVRNPQARSHLDDFQERVMKKMLGMQVASKEQWESVQKEMMEAGINSVENMSYEQMRDFVIRDNYSVTMNQEHHIAIEMKGIEAVLPCFFQRGWTLLIASETAGPFITSDRPVVLTWRDPKSVPPFYRQSPGLGMASTRVAFPISKEMAIVGEFELDDNIHVCDEKTVATFNSHTAFNAVSQIYAPSFEFKWLTPQLEVRDGKDLLTFATEGCVSDRNN